MNKSLLGPIEYFVELLLHAISLIRNSFVERNLSDKKGRVNLESGISGVSGVLFVVNVCQVSITSTHAEYIEWSFLFFKREQLLKFRLLI